MWATRLNRLCHTNVSDWHNGNFLDSCNDVFLIFFFVVRDVTEYTLYGDHYQAYLLNLSYLNDRTSWRFLTYHVIQFCFVSFISSSSIDKCFIPKRWPYEALYVLVIRNHVSNILLLISEMKLRFKHCLCFMRFKNKKYLNIDI